MRNHDTYQSNSAKPEIIHNRCRCKLCGDIIESTDRHEFVTCRCGACSVDGGHDYLRRCFASPDYFEELSVIKPCGDSCENNWFFKSLFFVYCVAKADSSGYGFDHSLCHRQGWNRLAAYTMKHGWPQDWPFTDFWVRQKKLCSFFCRQSPPGIRSKSGLTTVFTTDKHGICGNSGQKMPQ